MVAAVQEMLAAVRLPLDLERSGLMTTVLQQREELAAAQAVAATSIQVRS